MKKLLTTIHPDALSTVAESIFLAGHGGMTAIEVRGTSRQKRDPQTFCGITHQEDLYSRVVIELILEDEYVDEAVGIIVRECVLHPISAGVIFITDILEVVCISDGVRGVKALNQLPEKYQLSTCNV